MWIECSNPKYFATSLRTLNDIRLRSCRKGCRGYYTCFHITVKEPFILELALVKGKLFLSCLTLLLDTASVLLTGLKGVIRLRQNPRVPTDL